MAEATQHFITAMDVLKLGMHEVDQVQPPLSDLLLSLHRVPQLPPDFPGKAKARDWVARLAAMRATLASPLWRSALLRWHKSMMASGAPLAETTRSSSCSNCQT